MKVTNPISDEGLDKGSGRVYRGGGWCGSPRYMRASDRSSYDPAYRDYYIGFRLVRNK